MQVTNFIWFNGTLVPWDQAKIHVLTHALHYGGAAFEGIRCYETPQGPAVFALAEHIERFLFSAEVLKLPLTYSKEQIMAACVELLRANQLSEGYIRPIAFYSYGKMGVNPVGAPVDFAIACWPWGAYLPHDAVDIKTSRYIRIHPDSTVVAAKLAGHYLNGILASLELSGTHYHEALFLDSQGYISEGAGENFFIFAQGTLYTPKLGTILPGITRSIVMQIARELGYQVVETDLSLQQAYQAEEAFFTGTAAEVTPIRSIDDHVISNGGIGSVTSAIKAAYAGIVRGQKPGYEHYLTYV